MRTYLKVFSKLVSCLIVALCCLLLVSGETYAASVQKTDVYGYQATHDTTLPPNFVTINNEIPTDPATVTVSDSPVTITSGIFEKIADEPGPREGHVTAAYNDVIWSIAGVNDFGPAPPVRTYNPETNTWNEVTASQAPFGEVLFHSGCQVRETVYMYVDSPESGNIGLYSYNMETNQWTDLTTAPGQPPPEVLFSRYGAWVHDPEENLCILTGAFHNVFGEPISNVHVYDPVDNKWWDLNRLPNFTTPRITPAAWIVGTGPDRKLCIAGGNIDNYGLTEEESLELHKTTQCLPHGASDWNAENADLGPLPEFVSRMGYTKKTNCQGKEELWLVGGVDWVFGHEPWFERWWVPVDTTYYFDSQTGSWVKGPLLASGAAADCGAVVLDNKLFKISGNDVEWESSTQCDKLVLEECPSPPITRPKCIPSIYLLLHLYED